MRFPGLTGSIPTAIFVILLFCSVCQKCLASMFFTVLQGHHYLTKQNAYSSSSPVQEFRSEVLLQLLIDQGLDAVVAAVLL